MNKFIIICLDFYNKTISINIMTTEFTSKLHSLLKNTKLRLKHEYDWSDDFVNGAVNEYGRFLHLHKLLPNGKLVPGKAVDKVWHDHILHTRDYIKFCETELGGYLHHDPKDQSIQEMNDMKPTIELYTSTFGHPPPSIYWLEDIKTHIRYDTNTTNNNTTHSTISYNNSCCRCK